MPPEESLTLPVGQAKIGNYVWLDVDGNGLQDDVPVPGIDGPGVGLADVTVRLYQDDGDGVFEPQGDDVLSLSTATDGVGAYALYTAVGGASWVEIDRDTLTAGLWDVGGGESMISPYLLTALPGEIYDDVDFGFTAKGSVTGIVFYDRNIDGVQGLGEEGASGVEVCLYKDATDDDALGPDDELVECQTTDPFGAYVFGEMLYGRYLVVETPRPDVGHITPSVLSVFLNSKIERFFVYTFRTIFTHIRTQLLYCRRCYFDMMGLFKKSAWFIRP